MSEMQTIQPKNLEIAGKKFENSGVPREVFLCFFFLEILDNSVPCATGSCQKFKPDVLFEWKASWAFSPSVPLSYLVMIILFIIVAYSCRSSSLWSS